MGGGEQKGCSYNSNPNYSSVHRVPRKQTGKALTQPRGSAQEFSQPQLRREHLLMPSPEGNIWLLLD